LFREDVEKPRFSLEQGVLPIYHFNPQRGLAQRSYESTADKIETTSSRRSNHGSTPVFIDSEEQNARNTNKVATRTLIGRCKRPVVARSSL